MPRKLNISKLTCLSSSIREWPICRSPNPLNRSRIQIESNRAKKSVGLRYRKSDENISNDDDHAPIGDDNDPSQIHGTSVSPNEKDQGASAIGDWQISCSIFLKAKCAVLEG